VTDVAISHTRRRGEQGGAKEMVTYLAVARIDAKGIGSKLRRSSGPIRRGGGLHNRRQKRY
jgi:hypothetical protein